MNKTYTNFGRGTVAITAMMLFATSAFTGQPISERRSVAPDAYIEVKNVKGEIRIDGWDRPEVEIKGELGEGSRALEVRGSESRLSVIVEIPRNGRNVEETILYLQVPLGASLEVESVSAEVEIHGMRSPRIDASSVSGEVTIEADVDDLEATVVSGDIEFSGSARRAEFNSVSGDIDARGIRGKLSVSTVSGEALLRASDLTDARLESVSGDYELDFTLAPDGTLGIESLSGDVDLSLPASASFRLEAETFSGRIRSDKGTVRESKHGSHQRLEFTSEGGNGRVRIESFSGDIRINSRGAKD